MGVDPATVAAMAQALPQVNDALSKWRSSASEVSQDREEFTRATIKHCRAVYAKWNVLIVDNKLQHHNSLVNYAHTHVEIPRTGFGWFGGTHGFDIYIFTHGHFPKGGDGGHSNWNFGGNYKL